MEFISMRWYKSLWTSHDYPRGTNRESQSNTEVFARFRFWNRKLCNHKFCSKKAKMFLRK